MHSIISLVSGPYVVAAQTLIWSYSCVFSPPMSTIIRTSACVCVCVCELSMSFYIFHMHKIYIADHMNLICSLYSWWEGFGKVFFLSHTAPGFQYWAYFHLCMWVFHWGLHLRLSWRTWVCPSKCLLWRWYSFLGHRCSGSTRNSGELVARVARNVML